MLFVDGRLSVNVDPLICGNEKQRCVIMGTSSEMEKKKTKQQANQRVDQNNPDGWPSYYKDWAHWKKRQQKWAESTHEWCGRLCNTSQHAQRARSRAIYFTHRHHWRWHRDGQCTQWRRKTDVTSLGTSNPQIATVKKLSSQELLPVAQFMISANDRHNGKRCGQQHLDDQQSPNPDKPNLCWEAREEREKRNKTLSTCLKRLGLVTPFHFD